MKLLSPSLLHAAIDHPLMVGFSGGLDSTVLLHLLAHAPGRAPDTLRAVHVHHGLQAVADDWDTHCRQVCQQWKIPLRVIRVDVPRDAGDGLEAAARKARHDAFMDAMQPGEWLALAHHQDDQAETFLMRALRGSGVDGLAAMRERRDFGPGQLWRPLLHIPRSALEAYARQHQLRWIEDPSNDSEGFDRNFLRRQVMPLLRERWPHAAAAMARSAALAADASELLELHDARQLQGCEADGDALSITALQQLPATQRARVLRRWARQQGLPALPAQGVHIIERQLLTADDDQQAEFRWQRARIVRWRDRLHAVADLPPWPSGWAQQWDGQAPVALPDGARLSLDGADRFDRPLTLRQRRGGERIQLPGRTHSHLLKHRLQASDIAPWLRPHLPLLCDGDTLLAAGDRIVSASLQQWLQAHGAGLHWQLPDTFD
ncbi:tRNA lysidine(34) synthetase TilS [Stenotrophomonas sp. SY1]|uniref:tRNA lysidine(34) synthetase TilS n=1 Tax=Stenotrophomonas sp. SY1 TaxID=477235 RepID=UPI001E4DE8EE|nr:tRNA lysidine(34) synthetase TilS [Stenotrophomonas sp. SY1]MCD9086531.1 tRNA lysidine(34) synthetase TilS [Stenotrophomonas sp. SY1]